MTCLTMLSGRIFKKLQCSAPSAATQTMAAFLCLGFAVAAGSNLLAPSLSRIATALGVDPSLRDYVLGGLASTFFWLVGAPLSLASGVLTDAVSRRKLGLAVALVCALVMLGHALVETVPQLLALRAAHGVLFGTLQPLSFSILGDLYPPSRRPTVSSYVGLSIGGGIAVGQLVAGAVVAGTDWRAPYAMCAGLCVVSALVLWRFALEPARCDWHDTHDGIATTTAEGRLCGQDAGKNSPCAADLNAAGTAGNVAVESHTSQSVSGVQMTTTTTKSLHARRVPSASPSSVGANPAPAVESEQQRLPPLAVGPPAQVRARPPIHHPHSHRRTVPERLRAGALWCVREMRNVLRVPTNRVIYAQSLFGTVGWAVATVFLTDYLTSEKGMTTGRASLTVLAFGVGAILGGLGGGAGGSWLYRRYGPASQLVVVGVVQAITAAPVITLLHMPAVSSKGAWPVPAVLAIAVVSGFLASMAGPNLRAVMLNTNEPRSRGGAITLAFIADSVAKGIAPTLVGAVVSRSGGERVRAFTAAACGWVASGLIVMLAARTVAADEQSAAADSQGHGAAASEPSYGGRTGTTTQRKADVAGAGEVPLADLKTRGTNLPTGGSPDADLDGPNWVPGRGHRALSATPETPLLERPTGSAFE